MMDQLVRRMTFGEELVLELLLKEWVRAEYQHFVTFTCEEVSQQRYWD
jgi:hypothetical protein